MLLLELVENVDEKLNVVHVLDAERLADGVDLDLESLLCISTGTSLQTLVIDQIWCLSDQEAEHLLHSLILLPSGILVLRGNALVVIDLALGLGLLVVTLRIHDRGILVHERVALSG